MKKPLLYFCLGLCTLGLQAQNKLTPGTCYEAYEYMRLKSQAGAAGPGINSTGAAERSVPVFINIEPGYSIGDLEKVDFVTIDEVLSTCILAQVPADRLLDLNNVACIRRVEISRRLEPQMDYARPSGKVDDVHSGFDHNGTSISFDGSGVVVGMMDTGLEANHVNFKNSDGTSRIQRLWHMTSSDGTSTMYTPATISGFTTDTETESHATHVAGILGGSYKGNGTYSHMSTATSASPEMRTESPIPYYGVATGADLAFSVGALYTANIVTGVKNIMDYAQEEGKPVVVNLSLGNTVGPHDGTDAYSRELSELGKKGIICISAGNDGEANISIVKQITESTGNNSALRTFVNGVNNMIDGVVDLWGTDDTPLTVQWGVYSTSAMTFTPVITVDGSNRQPVSTSGVSAFTDNFAGSISAQGYVDPSNNRFNVYTVFNAVSPKSTDKVIALYATGASVGQKLYLYSSTLRLTFSYKPTDSSSIVDGYTNGSAANSINDGACASNVISVGAYVSRTTCGALAAGSYWPAASGYTVGSIAPFSSYGSSFDGTVLPHVCAPGARIVSSYSRYYVKAANKADDMVGKTDDALNPDYWGTMNGTSMSCPFVTGTIGLWLEADPTLTYDRVMDVIKNTSDFNKLTMRPAARWGAGKIDALEGIKYVLANRAAIGTVWEDGDERMVITPVAGGYEVFIAGENEITLTLHDMQGRRVASVRGTDGTATIATDGLAKGIYILNAQTPTARLTRKIASK